MAKKKNPRRQPFTDGTSPGADQVLAQKFFKQTKASLLTPLEFTHEAFCEKAATRTGLISIIKCTCNPQVSVRWPGNFEYEQWTPAE